jgi:hypothetical protein
MNQTATPIQILLSVYNGAKYLPEQLASLNAQQDAPEWSLLWRDDGSSDGGASLLENQPRASRLIDDMVHLGAAYSFLRLLEAAPADAMVFAFCDQDDVWLPNKLARGWSWISSQPPERPALYFARQKLGDSSLRPIGLSPEFRRPPGFKNALVQNIAAGCTIMMNAASRRLILSAPPPPASSFHDWWSYILISGAGGTIYADPHPVLLYRQHTNNTVGSAASIIRRAFGVIKRGPAAFFTNFEAHLATLDNAGSLLTHDTREIVAFLRPLRELSPLRQVSRILAAGLYRQGLLEDLVLYIFILLGSRSNYVKAPNE